jgi:thiamine biosynthesis lipoprotein
LGSLGRGAAAVLLPAYLPQPRRRPFSSEHFIERWSWAMGQPVHLQLFAASEAEGYDAAALALAELRRVESRLTLFDDASDLCELNRQAGRRAIQAGEDLTFVLARAMEFKRVTAGAFDVAVEPLMRAWGFHSPRKTEPTPTEIAGAREAVARAQVVLDSGRVQLPDSTTLLDLGGIGVGYGLDRAAGVLRRLGIERAFLDVSGDCIAIGTPPDDEKGWTVAIAGPVRGSGTIGRTRLRNEALATSANTMSVVHYGRLVRGHVMNPKTGWPAEAMVQVSVKARTGIEADALSTSMLVSGRSAPGVVWYDTVKRESEEKKG